MIKVWGFVSERDFETVEQYESCIREGIDWDWECSKGLIPWVLNSLG